MNCGEAIINQNSIWKKCEMMHRIYIVDELKCGVASGTKKFIFASGRDLGIQEFIKFVGLFTEGQFDNKMRT